VRSPSPDLDAKSRLHLREQEALLEEGENMINRLSTNRRPDGRSALRRRIGPAGREHPTVAQGEMIVVAENAGSR
jgi:hypothetical protein